MRNLGDLGLVADDPEAAGIAYRDDLLAQQQAQIDAQTAGIAYRDSLLSQSTDNSTIWIVVGIAALIILLNSKH